MDLDDYKALYSMQLETTNNITKLETKVENIEKWQEDMAGSVKELAEAMRTFSAAVLQDTNEKVANLNTRLALVEQAVQDFDGIEKSVKDLQAFTNKIIGAMVLVNFIGLSAIGVLITHAAK